MTKQELCGFNLFIFKNICALAHRSVVGHIVRLVLVYVQANDLANLFYFFFLNIFIILCLE